MNTDKSVLGFEQKVLDIVYNTSKRLFWPVFIHNTLITFLVCPFVDIVYPIAWFCWITLLIIFRFKFVSFIYHHKTLDVQQKLKYIQYLVFVIGLSHCLTVLFIPYLPAYQQATVSLILSGLCIASIFTNAGYKPLLYTYVIPVLFSLSMVWAFFIDNSVGGSAYITGLVFITYMFLLLKFGNDIRSTFFESYGIRLEMMELNERLEKALISEEKSNQAKTRFLASASHDLRQPLNTLSLYSAAMNFQKLDEKSTIIANNMKTAVDVLSVQLDSLLDISKLDAGIVDVKLCPIKLNDLLSRLQQEYLHFANEKNLDLRVSVEPDIVVYTDYVQFERILRNLISNAIKYTDEGYVDISAQIKDDQCFISIQDSGRGIALSQQQKVFEEFYQISNANRDRGQGLGLGLSIVKRLCKMLGVTITLESKPDQGTCISLYLPIEDSNEPFVISEDYNESDLSIFENLDVLIVDDELLIREGMRALFTSLKSQTYITYNCKKAIELASFDRPDIALVDYRLQDDENGVETILELRKLYPDLPAIIITGDIDEKILHHIDKYDISMLHKPIKLEELTAKVKQLLC